MQTAKMFPLSYYDGGDAIEFLRAQHREIDQLVGAIATAPRARDRARLLAEAGDLLAVHMAVEERIFYPGLTPEPEGEGQGFVVLAVEDHFDLKRLLAELLALDVEDDAFVETTRRLADQLRRHTAAEERLFPRIRRRLTRARLRRLDYEMRVLEFQLRTDAAPRRLVIEDESSFASA
jgi:hypothetical protein